MPRRNFWLMTTLLVVCLACHARANRYGQIFSYALEQVFRRSLEPIAERTLLEGGLAGMMEELSDQHSVYIRPKVIDKLRQSLDPKFAGVGVEIVLDPATKQLTVASPLFGAPAYEAGVRSRDKILRIDGRSTQGLSLEDASDLMRGKAGAAVVLTVQHEGESQPVDIRIVRAEIRVSTVLGDTRNADGSWNYFLEGCDRIGYVRIHTFAEPTGTELRDVLERLLAEKMRGLVLDLRDDPGGVLQVAVDICNLFIRSGVIVTTRVRDGTVLQTFEAVDDGTLPDFPMAVLVNGYSASASEIVAACLQDYGRAVIVGQRTFGKGTVQEIVDLPGKHGAIKVTAASYWRPSEKNINRAKDAGENDEWGVKPDAGYEVKLEGEPLVRLLRWRHERGASPPPNAAKPPPKAGERHLPTDVDPQLAKAVQYLEKTLCKL
jgi:carboxyl-terminal processing protease